MLRPLLLAVCCLGLLPAPSRGDDPAPPAAGPASDEPVRAAIARSLTFLEQDGVAWMQERNCMSCHHVPFLLWSHRAAQARGLTVDPDKLAAWDTWTRQDSLSHRNLYRLQNYDLGRVDPQKLPAAVKDKLQPLIERPFTTQPEFVAELVPLLTEEERTAYEPLILQTAERTPYHVDRAGGGLDVLAQLLLGNRGTASVLNQPEFRDGVIRLMQQIQLPDGSWTPGNQFATMRRWPLPAANQTTTMWAALALSGDVPAGAPRSTTIEKAIASQRQQSAHPDNREWLATRLLFVQRLGTAEEARAARQALLDARNTDGGWGWEAGVPSDALTTGLALYVLATATGADPADAAAMTAARHWLLTAQQPDGSWLTPSRNITKSTDPERLKARDEIYHYWGTAWAALGLLETLPRPRT